MLKFIFGPLTGVALGLSLVECILLTIIGMMLTVVILSVLGNNFRSYILDKYYPNRRVFTPRNRRIVKVWNKYGLFGISFLTPLFFSPPIGTLIVVAFGEKKIKIIAYMLVSAIFWSIFFNMFGQQLQQLAGRLLTD